MIVIFLLFLILKKGYIRYSENQFKWVVIFTLDLILIFIIILSSEWAHLNRIPRRYFGCRYISFWLVFLITFVSLQKIKKIKLINGLLLLTVILEGLGTIYNYKYISPIKLTPTIKTVREFEKLGKIGILSEYWNSYLSSASNPSQIKATPHKDYNVRNQNLVDSVFAADNFRYIDLDFETVKRNQNLEFRIYFYGTVDLYFSHVILKEK